MIVTRAGALLRLDARAVVGAGGEATVFALDARSVAKIYHRPSAAHARKLDALIARRGSLPPHVLAPFEPLYDGHGADVVGCVLPRAGASFRAFATLLHRSARGPGGPPVADVARSLASLAEAIAGLHAVGIVVGDVNDQNELVGPGGQACLIDVDSFQLDGEPCPVAAVDYLDPALYDVDLSAAPAFGPGTDAYAFAVLAFRTLLGAHPYGGVHPRLGALTDRALARVWAFDPGVRYPAKVARPREVLSDALDAYFEAIFCGGARPPLAPTLFRDHADRLVRCVGCGLERARERARCPSCAPAARPAATPACRTTGCDAIRLLETEGVVRFVAVDGQAVHAVVDVPAGAIEYVIGEGVPRTRPLGPSSPLDRYALLVGGHLVRARGQEVLVFGAGPGGGDLSTTTETFDGAGEIAAAGDSLVRLAGGLVLRGRPGRTGLVERAVANAAEGQTRLFGCAGGGVLGALRLFRHVDVFYAGPAGRRDLALPPLAEGEALRELELLGDGRLVLALRVTDEAGVRYGRFDLIDAARGHVVCAHRAPASAEGGLRSRAAGRAFRGLTLLHPSDEGVVREELAQGGAGDRRLIDGTAPFVSAESTLIEHPRGLVVADGGSLTLLTPNA